jgi:hypothetical protein
MRVEQVMQVGVANLERARRGGRRHHHRVFKSVAAPLHLAGRSQQLDEDLEVPSLEPGGLLPQVGVHVQHGLRETGLW